jgi:hypothetical protein
MFVWGCGGGESPTSLSTASNVPIQTAALAVKTTPVISIQSRPSGNIYPSSYETVAQSSVTDDRCLVSANQISYPAEYRGNFPLPKLAGGSLSHVPLTIGPFDNWDDENTENNPNQNSGCRTSFRSAFLSTLERVRSLGSKKMLVTQYVCNYTGLNYLHQGRMNISDTDLIWMASNIRSQGLIPVYAFQICDQGLDAYTPQMMEKMLDSYREIIMQQARIAESAGYAAMSVDWEHWQPDWNKYAEIRARRLSEITDDMRTVFKGQLYLMHNWGSNTTSKELLKKVDYIWWIPETRFTAEEEKNLTVELALARFRRDNNGHFSYYGDEPVEVIVRNFSHAQPTTMGWTELTGCFDINPTCGKNYKTDFSVQAILTEAALRYISELPKERVTGVTFNNYWLTDTLTAHDSFPNLGWNIRNKPAEHIVYKWWQK